MNKLTLLDMLIGDAQEMAEKKVFRGLSGIGDGEDNRIFEDALYELFRKKVTVTLDLDRDAADLIPELRVAYKDDVTIISMILGNMFPDQFIFFRTSSYTSEILAGIEFFSDVIPLFQLSFSSIGKRHFGRYLELNERLQTFAGHVWPEADDGHKLLNHFVCESLPRLFLEKSNYNRYWIGAVTEKNMGDLKSGEAVEWSGNKEVQEGDVIFVYSASPVSALTHIYEVTGEPIFDPYGAWGGFWMLISPICSIPQIPFRELKAHPVIGEWGTVKKQFTGTVTEPIPHRAYNALLELIPSDLREAHDLHPEQIETKGVSGNYHSEEHFEDEVITPLLQRLAFTFRRQQTCKVQVGRQTHVGRIDYLVYDQSKSLTLFENKFRIVSEKDLVESVNQAQSYALFLGLPSFVVAAPEGIWVYSLQRTEERLEMHVEGDELGSKEDELRSKLLSLGQ